jgi:hypothetical protein
MALVIISSTLSYLVNCMRYTIIFSKRCISFQGILAIFFSVLFREVSFLILMSALIPILFVYFDEKDPLFWPALFFLFLLVQDATSLFFSQQKLYAKSLTGYLFAFWTSIVGRKKYVYCFPEFFCYKKKIMFKFNISVLMWPLGVLFKVIFYIYILADLVDEGMQFVFYTLLIGIFSELLSHFFSFVYYKFCHVWKNILPAKQQKRNLKIFSSKFEIIFDEEENIGLLTKNAQ